MEKLGVKKCILVNYRKSINYLFEFVLFIFLLTKMTSSHFSISMFRAPVGRKTTQSNQSVMADMKKDINKRF